MIQQAETLIKYGYLALDLPPQSSKRILAACDECGKIREISKNNYSPLCMSCAQKDKTLTNEHKALISVALEGRKLTEGHKANMSKNHADAKGANNPRYNGGKKAATARMGAKRRGLGHTPIYPVKEGEVGHHFTDEHLGGIPADVHNSIGGRRKKHRTRVLQWLKANDKHKYKMVLCILAKGSYPIR